MAKMKPIKLFLLSVCASAIAFPVIAQDEVTTEPEEQPVRLEIPPPIEEVMVVASVRDVVGNIFTERLNSDVVVDLLDAEAMSRIGDSTVSAALVRVPGLTVVNDKFVYVRGLGERYSSAQLNGAQVPSPDLTRNVIPLDIFPTSILDNVSVQKGYSVEMPAAFAGGNIDIRTKSIPNDFVLDVSVGLGTNTDNGDYGLEYSGGSDDEWGTDDGTRGLPAELSTAIQTYRGNFNISNIQDTLGFDNPNVTIDDAIAANRQLATALNRDIDITDSGSVSPAYDAKAVLGNRWYFGSAEDIEFGFISVASYDNSSKNRTRINRGLQFNEGVEADYSEAERSVYEIGLTGALNLGFEFRGEHKIDTSSLYIRNTEDESTIRTKTNNNFRIQDGQQLRDLDIRFEERELITNQIRGSHEFGPETMNWIGENRLTNELLKEGTFSWYYSDSKATTDIPNEVGVSAIDSVDPNTGAVLSTAVRSSGSAADFRFTNLEDTVESYGWDFERPWYYDDQGYELLKIAFGWDTSQKARDYRQTQFNIGTIGVPAATLTNTVSGVFSDANIQDPNNGYALSVGGIGTESYLAAQITDAAYAKFDFLVAPEWRVVAGARWEQFSQASLPIDPLEFDPAIGQVVIPSGSTLEDLVFQEEDIYPSLTATYTREDGFMGTNDFKLRLGWSETVSRPDLREISTATYIDPLTEFNVTGNPGLITSSNTNFDARAEWFWDEDSFTISAFYKDILDPIETIESDGSEDNVFLTFINGESAKLYGLEFEAFKTLDFLGNWGQNFFLSGNFTWSDSEVNVGNSVLAEDARNPIRPMAGHSEYVTNIQLGFDSPNGLHNATLAYNTFSERLYFAGKVSSDDAFEQPFHSLNVSYSYYPTDRITLDFKIKNLLDEQLEIDQGFFRGTDRLETTILEQSIGTSISAGLKYSFGN